jgi:hypothetical protein
MNEIYVTHRLDRLTSGLLIMAKQSNVCEALSKMIRERTVQKVYLAKVIGDFNFSNNNNNNDNNDDDDNDKNIPSFTKLLDDIENESFWVMIRFFLLHCSYLELFFFFLTFLFFKFIVQRFFKDQHGKEFVQLMMKMVHLQSQRLLI